MRTDVGLEGINGEKKYPTPIPITTNANATAAIRAKTDTQVTR